jgi:hypothetical protein
VIAIFSRVNVSEWAKNKDVDVCGEQEEHEGGKRLHTYIGLAHDTFHQAPLRTTGKAGILYRGSTGIPVSFSCACIGVHAEM